MLQQTKPLSDELKLEFWIVGALHHICSWKIITKPQFVLIFKLPLFIAGFSLLHIQQPNKQTNKQKNHVEKIKVTPPYLTFNSIDQNPSFFWFSLLKFVPVAAPKGIDAPTSKKLQHSPTTFSCTKIRVLNIGGTPPCLPLKSTDKKAQLLFDFQAFDYAW